MNTTTSTRKTVYFTQTNKLMSLTGFEADRAITEGRATEVPANQMDTYIARVASAHCPCGSTR